MISFRGGCVKGVREPCPAGLPGRDGPPVKSVPKPRFSGPEAPPGGGGGGTPPGFPDKPSRWHWPIGVPRLRDRRHRPLLSPRPSGAGGALSFSPNDLTSGAPGAPRAPGADRPDGQCRLSFRPAADALEIPSLGNGQVKARRTGARVIARGHPEKRPAGRGIRPSPAGLTGRAVRRPVGPPSRNVTR